MADRSDDLPRGWVKPTRQPTLEELDALIAAKRAELRAMEEQAQAQRLERRLTALAQARNIMRAHGLTIDDLSR